MESKNQISNCLLWSVYGDALAVSISYSGRQKLIDQFIIDKFEMPIESKRLGGPVIPLLKGCYSSDTQLRLATARCIRKDGVFDVEAFAKVELPVWRSYSILPRASTKAAAKSLIKSGVQWNNNFFQNKDGDYFQNTGCDCATRILPHVLASPPLRKDSDILSDVLRNTIVTHGSPVSIVGACFHALCVSFFIRENRPALPSDLRNLASNLRYLPKLVKRDNEIRDVWLSVWESTYGQSLEIALLNTVDQLLIFISRQEKQNSRLDCLDSAESFQLVLPRSSLLGDPIEAAFLASWIASEYADRPIDALLKAAKFDVDGLLTMVGALVGAFAVESPPHQVADQEYILQQSNRLQRLGDGAKVNGTSYPDLLSWQPPKNEIDYVGKADTGWQLAGLGEMMPLQSLPEKDFSNHTDWHWFQLQFGQCVLLKHRQIPDQLDSRLLPLPTKPPAIPNDAINKPAQRTISAEQALSYVTSAQNRNTAIGEVLIELLTSLGGEVRAKRFVELLGGLLNDRTLSAVTNSTFPNSIGSLITRWKQGERFNFRMFYGHKPPACGIDGSCFSQWFERSFVVESHSYPTAEHWMMAEKARIFNDPDSLRKILDAPDPRSAKAIGRKVSGFDPRIWDNHKRLAVFTGNYAKFSQHTDLRDYLLTTGGTILVEASPKDKIWGIGLSATSASALDPTRWQGENLLGFVLTEVREKLLTKSI